MTYTLTGRYPLGDLTGRDGEHLRLTPSTTIVGDDNIVLPAPVPVTLDSDGAFSVELVGTDDPDYAPTGWVWVVQELMDGGRAPWAFELTADSDLSELAATTVPGSYVTLVPTSRTLTAGAGLTGGGTLAADRSFAVGAGTGVQVNADSVEVLYGSTAGTAAEGSALTTEASTRAAADIAVASVAAGALAAHEADSTAVHGIADTAALVTTARTVTAGAGLTGGGDLSANRTVAVGAGTGITVNADDVAVAYGTTAGTAAQGNDSRITGAAPAANPTLTGTVTIPTPAAGSETTVAASTAWAAERAKIGNLLTTNEASVETGTTGFTASAATLARASGGELGTYALEVTCTGASGGATLYGSTTTGTMPVTPLQPYTFRARVKAASITRVVYVKVFWWQANGTSAASTASNVSAGTTLSTSWQLADITAVAPANAAFASLQIYAASSANTEVYLVDAIGFWAGAGGDWAMPGTPITNLGVRATHPLVDDVLVQRWDSSKAAPGWQTIHYDSGWRDISALVASGTYTPHATEKVYLRRVGSTVFLRGRVDTVAAWSTVGLLTAGPPTGFRGELVQRMFCRSQVSTAGTGCEVYTSDATLTLSRLSALAATCNADAAGTVIWPHVQWTTPGATLPTTLPGTLVSAAPA